MGAMALREEEGIEYPDYVRRGYFHRLISESKPVVL
jgi:hypothetical protein